MLNTITVDESLIILKLSATFIYPSRSSSTSIYTTLFAKSPDVRSRQALSPSLPPPVVVK